MSVTANRTWYERSTYLYNCRSPDLGDFCATTESDLDSVHLCETLVSGCRHAEQLAKSTYVLVSIRIDSGDDDKFESLEQFGDTRVHVGCSLNEHVMRKVEQRRWRDPLKEL